MLQPQGLRAVFCMYKNSLTNGSSHQTAVREYSWRKEKSRTYKWEERALVTGVESGYGWTCKHYKSVLVVGEQADFTQYLQKQKLLLMVFWHVEFSVN